MDATQVIKYPILTEKSSQKIDQGIYTFAVDKNTNKAEVKKVVEFIFDVKVEKVNISNVRKKPKRLGKFRGFKSSYKKAVVTLKNGSIKMFQDDVVSSNQISEDTTTQIEKEKQISEIEKKAAAKIAAKAAEKAKQEQLRSISEEGKKSTPEVKHQPAKHSDKASSKEQSNETEEDQKIITQEAKIKKDEDK